ncbi:PepSY domain-containing protein [Parerythrobacter aurantius]|uniref:PepSY domain-containing protein n=1 Tax=Parerythrobacter aurantius TaxID=3127706 RepID=UPI003253281F
MANGIWMRRFARWHIWLGWLVGVPMVMWLVTGLLMVVTPIDEVRGNHLRIEQAAAALPPDTEIAVALPGDPARAVRSVTTAMERGRVVTTITYLDDTSEHYDAAGRPVPPVSDVEARQIVAQGIRGGETIVVARAFDAEQVPFDFRRPVDVWQVSLANGTQVYVNRRNGTIEAVRTRWWRFFDVLFGLHVMDLETREPGPNPWILVFSGLAIAGAVLGCILMFRRRKAKVTA